MMIDKIASEVVIKVKNFYGQNVFKNFKNDVSNRKPFLKFMFGVVSLLHRYRLFNAILLAVVVLSATKMRKPLIEGGVFELAPSQNNKRVLERLNDVLNGKGKFPIDLNGGKVSLCDRVKLIFKIRDFFSVVNVLSSYDDIDPFIHTQQAIGCASVLVFETAFQRCMPKVLCVASDHNPICIAALSVARVFKLKTCYLQHAPVTSYFPPLDYDISLLFDRESLLTYETIADQCGVLNTGKVLIFPPFSTPFKLPRLKGSPVSVGVFVSFLPDEVRLNELIKEISAFEVVDKVVLRRHPRCQRSFQDILSNGKVSIQAADASLEDFFSQINLALVPNSGVAIEALHSGCPTFYVSGVDKLEDDYYCFVRKGVLPTFRYRLLEDLSEIDRFFNDTWLEKFGQFDETVYAVLKDQYDRVFKEFLQLYTDVS